MSQLGTAPEADGKTTSGGPEPIGVFDSGFGGLGVLRAIRDRLPAHNLVYLGDSARAPYGSREVDTILDFAEQCVERLFEEGCRVIVVACHTVSCVALRHLQSHYCGPDSERRILGVTIPAAEAAAGRGGVTGFLGTARTVGSGTFLTEMRKLNPNAEVRMLAAPLLAPIVEEGLENHEMARLAAGHYLDLLGPVDTLILGCTHYPLLKPVIEGLCDPGTAVLDPAPIVAERLADWLVRHPRFSRPGEGQTKFFSTGDPAHFSRHGARFFGEPLDHVEVVRESGGVLASLLHARETPAGQVVRAKKR